jgi:hypothetical protein
MPVTLSIFVIALKLYSKLSEPSIFKLQPIEVLFTIVGVAYKELVVIISR